MANKKNSGRLGKKERAEAEKNKLIDDLSAKYVEGESNIDYKKLPDGAVWKLFFSDGTSLKEKEEILGMPIPLFPKAEWLEKEIAEHEAEKPKELPSYRVQDPIETRMKYRQKFIEKYRNIQPEVINDLRRFVGNFDFLLGKSKNRNMFGLVEKLKWDLSQHRRVFPSIDYNLTNRNRVWSELEALTICLLVRRQFEKTDVKIANRESFEKLFADNDYKLNAAEAVIKSAFLATAKNEEEIMPQFLNLAQGIFEWAKKYRFDKDWLIGYAYCFIEQMNEDENLTATEIIINRIVYDSKTMYDKFKFEANGWLASEVGETAATYKARVKKEFDKEIDSYLSEATEFLKLDKLKKFTKPPTYENVDWLVYSLVKNCTGERLVEKFYPEIAADKTKDDETYRTFENKRKHIESEIRELKEYGLPENPQL